MDPIDLEYDHDKSRSNFEKHGLWLWDVVLLDWSNARIRVDSRKDYGETRLTALAIGPAGLCHVTYTMRGTRMRVISFRRAHERERKSYDT